MTESRFQFGVSAVLLLSTAWYVVQMASYGGNAGRVPMIVALIMAAALLIQIVGQWRARNEPSPGSEERTTGSGQEMAEAVDIEDPLATAEERAHEVEEASSGFGVLLALDKARRNRLFAIVAFSILFYLGALMAGFVVATGVLITGFMLVARERLWTALLVGVVSSAAIYALLVLVLDLPPLDGYLF